MKKSLEKNGKKKKEKRCNSIEISIVILGLVF